MKQIIPLLLLFATCHIFAQGSAESLPKYPADYFRSPLDIPLLLSGTFGELRSNHFHSGLDLKTQQTEGFKVYAAASGYVSRIKISHWGFGKALYITHPNGYTTVYAHLKKFSPRIESYIKKLQYKKESFEIQVFPKSDELVLSPNEVIALSGSTGGFVGPHLHFEIRDTKSEKPINPLYFGLKVPDSKAPRINTVMAYALDDQSHINQTNVPTQLIVKKLDNGNLMTNRIKAYGAIGFGINSFDQLDGAYNKNGLYSLTMKVNGNIMHEFKASSFAFSETRYLNLLIDYERFEKIAQRIQKCYTEPSNQLSMYGNYGNGYVSIEDGKDYTIAIEARDYKGNLTTITIPVVGKKDSLRVVQKIVKTPYWVDHTKYKKIEEGDFSAAFPSNTFYENFYLDFSVEGNSVVKVHEPTLPLHKSYTLTFKVDKYDETEREKMYIASIDEKGEFQYVSTVKKENTFYTSTRNLGKFTLRSDTTAPIIELKNFKNEQWLTNFNSLVVTIEDSESGIKSYRGEIDGAWILMEYNVKNGTLTYDLNDKQFTTAKHELKVVVTDNVGNTNNISATFFRKK